MPHEAQSSLFPDSGDSAAPEHSPAIEPVQPDAVSPTKAKPRYTRPQRNQTQLYVESLDQRLDPDHTARIVWNLVEKLDLTVLYDRIRATEGHVGRNPSDPKVLFALWLYAAIEGVGSARRLEVLCREQRGFEWLRGEVPVNYHLLSDFRIQHQDLLDQLLTDSLAGLLHEGLIDLQSVAQDGLRIRASAGKSSFRRQPTLEEALKEAQEHVAAVKAEAEQNAGTSNQSQLKARERAARERAERVEKAHHAVQEIAQQRESRKKGDGDKARASTTDPEARNMKMADGGFRPAFNAQLATDTNTGIIMGVDVINQGTDAGQLNPMMEQIERRLGMRPKQALADGAFATVEDIEQTTRSGTTVFAPVKEAQQQLDQGINPYQAKPGDSPTIGEWRTRMGTEMAKAIYKLRAQTAELTNARMRNRGLYSVNVRSLAKVKTVLLWYVLANNLLLVAAIRSK